MENDDYQKGVNEGFRIAESHFVDWLKEMTHELKTHILEIRATTTTTSNFQHKCNFEFCRVDKKKLEI